MPCLFAVVELKAGDADQPALAFRAEHVIGLQPFGKERERPGALFPERRAESRRMPLKALQADRSKRLCVGAGEASDWKRG